MNNKVYILLPVHNRKNITLKFIDLLKSQKYSKFCILLIDDGSTDGTTQEVCIKFPETVVIKGKGNWWWGGSLHQGFRYLKKQNISTDDIVLIINDDSEISSDFISLGVIEINSNKNSLILATAFDSETKMQTEGGVFYNLKTNTITEVHENHLINCMTTRGLFINAQDFINLKGFHPLLLPHYRSDYEFTIRAWKRGYKLICSDKIKLWFDDKTTGIHKLNFKSLKWSQFFKQYFSKSYVDNPIYAINFYLLLFPFPYNFKHVYIELKKMMKVFFVVFKSNISGRK
ncbi:MAG TPA: glycosyltransferase [Bacteroidia bacterium]|nr:glycosyltransferase [Bacteroidia bacterium]HNU34776.1 glycosyltransferase [Bacteroidia bacterium]